MTINGELGLTSSIGTYLRLGASKHEEKESPERIHERDLFFKISNCEHKKVTLRNGVNGECGCIKCGLDNAILDRYKGYDWNNFDTKTQLDDLIMLNYLKSHTLKGRMILPYHCDLKIANEMYNSIQRKQEST